MSGANIRCFCALYLVLLGSSCSQSAPNTSSATNSGASPATAGGAGNSQPVSAGAPAAAGAGGAAGQVPPTVPVFDAAVPVPDAAPGTSDAQVAAPDAGAPVQPPTPMADAATPPAAEGCEPRRVDGTDGVHFHHIHMNSANPDEDLAFYEKMFASPAVDFCAPKAGGAPTRATRTDRGWFLYTRVATPPDPTLNSYLEHIGWIHPDPEAELKRLVDLDAPRFPVGRGQCETAVMGTAACSGYWFYLQAPNGARVEVALGPGPATMGFGHVHFVMGVDYEWFTTATDGAFQNQMIDMVNHTDALLVESFLDGEMVMDSRGKPVDHIGYSTTDLDAEKARILAAGLELAEDISFKPEYGFRSFFMRAEKGIWIELVEDTAFKPGP